MPDESLPLVPLPGSQLARQGSGSGRILDDMVSGALTTSQKEVALMPRYRIGDIDFCEPDYRQMLLWAEGLRMTPEEVLLSLWDEKGSLFRFLGPSYEAFNGTQIKAGKLQKVSWNFNKLPLKLYEWIQGLEIQAIKFVGQSPSPNMEIPLPTLVALGAEMCGLETLSLRLNPSLEILSCYGNELRELNLSMVPSLRKLDCDGNNLNTLDLSFVPELEVLCCGVNPIVELCLTSVPKLNRLDCDGSSISELDLSGVPELKSLDCSLTHISKLSLKCCEQLEYLKCSFGTITELDLGFTPLIRSLSCEGNMIEELDIRHLQYLEELTYDYHRTRLIQRPDQNF